MTTSGNPKKLEGLKIEPAHDGYLVMSADSRLVTWLNRTAYMVLLLSNGQNSPRIISATLRRVFDLYHDPISEIQQAIQELFKSGLISSAQPEGQKKKALLISVWAPGESVSVTTLKNIHDITAALDASELKYRLVIDSQPDFAMSRNRALSALLMRDSFSHLLLLDAKASATEAVLEVSLATLINSDHDFVTIPVKNNEPNWGKVSATTASSALSAGELSGFAYSYNVMFEGLQGPRQRSNGFFEARHTSMAAVLLSRTGIEKLAASNQVIRYRGLIGEQRIEYLEHYWGFFDTLVSWDRVVAGDVAFCERWRAAGGHIMATTAGSFGKSLRAAQALLKQR